MCTDNRNPAFDFDSWATLAKESPQLFEISRKIIIEQTILQALPRRRKRLRCLQWQLDQIRNTSCTPLAACLRMQHMLWDKLAGDGGLLACLAGSTHPQKPRQQRATILHFRN